MAEQGRATGGTSHLSIPAPQGTSSGGRGGLKASSTAAVSRGVGGGAGGGGGGGRKRRSGAAGLQHLQLVEEASGGGSESAAAAAGVSAGGSSWSSSSIEQQTTAASSGSTAGERKKLRLLDETSLPGPSKPGPSSLKKKRPSSSSGSSKKSKLNPDEQEVPKSAASSETSAGSSSSQSQRLKSSRVKSKLPLPTKSSEKGSSKTAQKQDKKQTEEPSNYLNVEPSALGKSSDKTSKRSLKRETSSSEASGSGVKKLLNHYSLRSQDKVQRNQPEIKSKKNSATDSSGGTSSNISESGDKESKSHKRTSATTGSCTSTSTACCSRGRWGGGGGGNSATGTGAGGGAGGSSSKGGDCGAMSDEVPPPTGDSPAPSGAGNGNSGGGGGGTAGGGGGVDSESDDSEVGRLQALLEARGLPPHLFGALAPRMHHLLHRTIGTNTSTKAQQLLAGLQATSDEGQQMQAVIEMCQMLVMGNEDTLAGFPVKQVVPALIALLNMEHNFDMMNHACRALTYMMEALPRSSAVVLDAVPVFLEKLQAIQCMDVAEQSLTALEMLSRRHSKAILQARGVWACLMYLDFFSINAQRSALAITANCCHNLLPEELHLVSQSIPLLASRLTQQDQKSVESVCLALSRLVEALQCDPPKLMQIASTELLTNLQQLLVVSPPLINTGTFITVVRMLTTMCSCCPELALTLLKNNIAETLCYLLTGRADSSQGEMELTSRSPAEVYEMTCLIGELMPRLPAGGLFAVDILLERPSPRSPGAPGGETVTWQWRDDAGIWHPYAPIDSKIIEAAHQTGEDEMSLSTFGRTYTVDFHSMQQINEDTGTARPVERRVVRPPPSQLLPNSLHQTASSVNNNTTLPTQESEIDANLRDVAGSFIRSLFSVLYEVYSSSAGPAVRHKCLKALLRMVYFATPQLLKEVLKAQMVSSQLAGMMASSDLRIVVSALQMAEILMQKLPDVFSIHFTREGVMHEIKQLADPNVPVGASPMKSSPASISSSPTTDTSTPGPSSSAVAVGATALASLSGGIPPTAVQQAVSNGALYTRISSSASGNPAENNPEELINVEDDEMPLSDCSPITRRMRELRKQKRSKRDKHKQDADVSPNIQELIAKHKQHSNALGLQSNRGNKLRLSGATSKTSNFLASLNPARWGRASDRTGYHKVSFHKESSLSKCSSTSNLWAGNREKVRSWVKERAAKFVANYASLDNNSSQDPSRILESLMKAIATLQSAHGDKMNALIELRDTLMGCDISPFEVNHSGLVKALLEYLTSKTENRETRIRTFLHVFANLPLEETGRDLSRMDPSCLQALVSKLNSCVSQLEQFPVKVHDLPAPAGSTTALKFFNTHQLKCQLARHPDCSSLKQWRGGTVKIDPLALVQAIERYLVVRGYAKVRDKHSTASDDDNSDDEFDDNMVGMVVGSARHKLQFLINDVVLPYNMTVYQAVKQFSPAANSDQSETDTDTEAPLGSANIWVQTHTVHYRPVLEEETSSKPATGAAGSSLSSATAASGIPRKGKGSSSKAAPKKKHDDLWNDGQIPRKPFPLDRYLVTELNSKVSTCDASLPVLCLLNALHAISIHWPVLYPAVQGRPLLLQTEFVNNKIAAKAGRQLQDPLVIMTGNLPPWLQQITSACPFLMPFETRQLLLYATAFDRDRALQRLLDSSPELGSGADSQERVTPRLDRRKRTVSRDDILKQAEALLQDMATSKALLEVQYENEVGTGLGPTLEFYALVSRELQRSELELWHSEEASTPLELSAGYVHSPVGLFPAPIPRTARVSQLMKLRNKFRFIGRFMAKAVMDSRMLDLPLSQTFHRWLLGEESSLGLADLAHVAPSVHRTLARLMSVVAQVNEISASSCLTEEEKKSRMEGMELDGCPIADLGLDFTLPGYPHVELRKNGKDISVTAYNLESYCKLVVHWFLVEGVQRQMECVREGMQCVFPTGHLGLFYPAELDAVFCGSGTDWDITSLVESCRPDHGYNQSSRAIKFLFDILSSYNREEQRDFVQFVTGSPRLPVGGFRALSPPLTIVRKTMDGNMNADDYLPSVMTCVNYLKLPDYSSLDIMKEKLRIAARDGQCSFHLS